MRRWLSYLPSNAWTVGASAATSAPTCSPIPSSAALVPAARRRGYDMRRFCRALLDESSFFELQPGYARNLTTGLGRLDGFAGRRRRQQPDVQRRGARPRRPAARPSACCACATRSTCRCSSSWTCPASWWASPWSTTGSCHWPSASSRRWRTCPRPTLTVTLRKGVRPGLAGHERCGHGRVGPVRLAGGRDRLHGSRRRRERRLRRTASPASTPERRRGRTPRGRGGRRCRPPRPTRLRAPCASTRSSTLPTPAGCWPDDLRQLAGRRIPPPEQRPLSYWPTV